MSGINNPMLDISLNISKERKIYLKSRTGKLNPNYGKTRSENTVNLIKKSLLNPYYEIYEKKLENEVCKFTLIKRIKYFLYVALFIGVSVPTL